MKSQAGSLKIRGPYSNPVVLYSNEFPLNMLLRYYLEVPKKISKIYMLHIHIDHKT